MHRNASIDVELDGLFRQNSSFDYDEDYVYEEEFDPKSSKPVWIPVVYSLVLVVGLLGNILLLAVLAQRRRSWRVSDTLILHLGIADVLLLVSLPLRAAQVAQSGLCTKICGAVFNVNFFCGIFLLVCISLDHYLSTVHATQVFSHRKPWSVHAACVSAWLLSLLLTIPDSFLLEASEQASEKKMACVHSYPGSAHRASRAFHHVVGFTLPAAVLIFCCASVLLRLQCSCKALRQQRAAMLILPLVGAFFLCWMPYNFTLIVDTLTGDPRKPRDEYLKTALLATTVLGCAHACVRPLLYLGLCRNFRKRSAALLRCVTVEPSSSLWELGVEDEEAPPRQDHAEDELKQMTGVVEQQTQADQC
ncbi:C-X-C chemokine receptor type 3.3 [Salarias fasciatus]|uniref:C-X-C chemokine receptor type 3-like n=1 Tax=Salarias fasciatus TaxID=181472 RepID=A0A672FA35_SALFA|nr:C-X-C chemokine receptor type 3-like [Salarias fasciatus]